MHERKPNRLKGYDYSTPGAYFITICVLNKENLFGKIENSKMRLNERGIIVEQCWNDLINHYQNIKLDEFIIMPNHFHGIIHIITVVNGLKPFQNKNNAKDNNVNYYGNGLKPFSTKQHGLPEIVRGFKTFSSRRINETNPDSIFRWQKSYYDRIIRNEDELNRIREYIINNPINWENDSENIKNNISKEYNP